MGIGYSDLFSWLQAKIKKKGGKSEWKDKSECKSPGRARKTLQPREFQTLIHGTLDVLCRCPHVLLKGTEGSKSYLLQSTIIMLALHSSVYIVISRNFIMNKKVFQCFFFYGWEKIKLARFPSYVHNEMGFKKVKLWGRFESKICSSWLKAQTFLQICLVSRSITKRVLLPAVEIFGRLRYSFLVVYIALYEGGEGRGSIFA